MFLLLPSQHPPYMPLTAKLLADRLYKAMKVIGLTGGIGSGKTTVSRFLAELGAVVIDADKLGHEVLKDPRVREEIGSVFGKQVLDSKEEVDRKKLAELVFNNTELLSKLNQIMKPRLDEMLKTRIDDYRRQGADVVVLEAAVLIEADVRWLVNEIWVTVAPEETILKRLRARTGLTREELLARIRSQLSTTERTRYADVVIDTNCTFDELKVKVGELWQKLLREKK